MDNYLENNKDSLVRAYNDAKQLVLEKGFENEILWQEGISFERITESVFLSEAAWVILSCGMKERVIRSKFSSFSDAFYSWESADKIIRNVNECRKNGLAIFGNNRKIDAVIHITTLIHREGFHNFKNKIVDYGIEFISTLPFMGPATSYHLAKNIGLDVVKPDRHLVRVSIVTGFESPNELCTEISKLSGDRISVVDLVIWRFATLNSGYLDFFHSYVK